MGYEQEQGVDKRMELHTTNLKRLEEIMGSGYDAMEMEDYASYFDPERMAQEIDFLEGKIQKHSYDKGPVIEKFKEHLGYMAC